MLRVGVLSSARGGGHRAAGARRQRERQPGAAQKAVRGALRRELRLQGTCNNFPN